MKKIVVFSLFSLFFASFCLADDTRQTQSMKLRVGDSFTITLRANLSSGYEWQLAKPLDEGMLQLVHSEYIPYSGKRLGADGKQLWTFKALKAGEASISFKYLRSFEKDTAPQKEETITVIIK